MADNNNNPEGGGGRNNPPVGRPGRDIAAAAAVGGGGAAAAAAAAGAAVDRLRAAGAGANNVIQLDVDPDDDDDDDDDDDVFDDVDRNNPAAAAAAADDNNNAAAMGAAAAIAGDGDNEGGDDDDGGGAGDVIDGGVAGAPPPGGAEEKEDGSSPKRKSTDCDLIIVIECAEKLQKHPSSITSRIGNAVSIGLHDKTTKMSALFQHYVQFCHRSNDPLRYDDVEFVHHETLHENETAESSALMKGDKIYVRRDRELLRAVNELAKREQRDSDREYIKQLRALYQESYNSTGADFGMNVGGPNVLLECRPYLEIGQRGVLNHFVKAHECIVSKRCGWLREKIEKAKADSRPRQMMKLPHHPPPAAAAMAPPQQQELPAVAPPADEQQQQGGGDGGGGMVVNRIPIGDNTNRGGNNNLVPPPPRPAGGGGEESSSSFARGVSRNDDDGVGDDEDEDSVVHYEPEPNAGQRIDGAMVREQGEGGGDGGNRRGERQEGGGMPLVAGGQQQQQQRAQVVDEDEDGDAAAAASSSPQNNRSILMENAAASSSSTARGARGIVGGQNVVPSSSSSSSTSGLGDMIVVSLPTHPPEAVKLLLEYCYAGRVISLGKEAFLQSCTATAVPPYSSSKWPNKGIPTVSMSITLAGIALAEEAQLSKLSLMCEIASSQLVNNSNVLDALAACTEQSTRSGNRLSILRKRAMGYLVNVPVLKELSHTRKFLRGLKERRDVVVPAILQGTAQDITLPPPSKRCHRGSGSGSSAGVGANNASSAASAFARVDEDDREARKMERLKRRTERQLARNGTGVAPFAWPNFS